MNRKTAAKYLAAFILVLGTNCGDTHGVQEYCAHLVTDCKQTNTYATAEACASFGQSQFDKWNKAVECKDVSATTAALVNCATGLSCDDLAHTTYQSGGTCNDEYLAQKAAVDDARGACF